MIIIVSFIVVAVVVASGPTGSWGRFQPAPVASRKCLWLFLNIRGCRYFSIAENMVAIELQ